MSERDFRALFPEACNRTTTAAVVDQRINCLLQHTFLVADDDIRSAQLQQSFQTVVSVDNTAVQIIQVGCWQNGRRPAVPSDADPAG